MTPQEVAITQAFARGFWITLRLAMIPLLVISIITSNVAGLILCAFACGAPALLGTHADRPPSAHKPRHQPTELDRLFEAAAEFYLCSPNMEVSELDELLEELGHGRVSEEQIRAMLKEPRNPDPWRTNYVLTA